MLKKPLIPSVPREDADAADARKKRPKKSPFNKRQLAKFRGILDTKRRELTRDVVQIERGALGRGPGGDRSRDMARRNSIEGTETFDQSLSFDLAAADRRLIAEIDAAIERIENGTFGLCEMTGNPIRAARLEELPWARYSIDAARALERGGRLS